MPAIAFKMSVTPKEGTTPSTRLPGPEKQCCTAKHVRRMTPDAFDYFSDRLDWSTVTPGPMVELTETFCR